MDIPKLRPINDDDEIQVVLCANLESILLLGGTQHACANCGKPCACSSEGQKQIDAGAKPFCFACGIALMKSDVQAEFVYSGQAMKAAIETIKKMEHN